MGLLVDMANAASDRCPGDKPREGKDDEERGCTFLSLVTWYVASSSARRYSSRLPVHSGSDGSVVRSLREVGMEDPH